MKLDCSPQIAILLLVTTLHLSAGESRYSSYETCTPRPKSKSVQKVSSTREKVLSEREQEEESRRAVMKLAEAVDKMAADVEEFGTVSCSAPLLTLPTHSLWFNLKNTADTYYTHARSEVAGRAFAATAIAQSLGVGVEANADLDQLAAARSLRRQIDPQMQKINDLEDLKRQRAKLAFQSKMAEIQPTDSDAVRLSKEQAALEARQKILDEQINTKPAEQPKTTNGSTPDVQSAAPQQTVKVVRTDSSGNPTDDPAKAVKTETTVSTTTEPSKVAPRVDPDLVAAAAISAAHTALGTEGKTFLGGDLQLPDLDAVKAAESATSLQGLENFFHYPEEAMQFRDKVVMMGAVTVSVEPGWRTSKEFAGEVIMENHYRFVPARRSTVARMITDVRLPERIRRRLAYEYKIPWYTPNESDQRRVAELEAKLREARINSAEARSRQSKAQEQLSAAKTLLLEIAQKRKTARQERKQRALNVITQLDQQEFGIQQPATGDGANAAPPSGAGNPAEQTPPAKSKPEQSTPAPQGKPDSDKRRREAQEVIAEIEKQEDQDLNDMERAAKEKIAAANEILIEAEGILSTEVQLERELLLAQQRLASSPIDFNTLDLPDVGGQGAEFGAGFGPSGPGVFPGTPGGTRGDDPRFLRLDAAPLPEVYELPPDLIYNEDKLTSLTPLVSGVSPLSQTDTLDLASEFRRQDQFALALAATLRQQGASGSAKVFEQFVKTQRKDVQTRSVSSTVASFSKAGGVIGFQIGPRLRALADPASRKNVSGFVLERQAFPALLIYGLDAQDLYPRLSLCAGHLQVFEPKIQNEQHSYWRPLTYRFQGPKDWFNPFKCFWPPIWWESALKQTTVVDRNLRFHDALWNAADTLPHGQHASEKQNGLWKEAISIQKRGLELKSRHYGATNDQYIPSEVLVPSGRLRLPSQPVVVTTTRILHTLPAKVVATLEISNGTKDFDNGDPQAIAIVGEGLNHVTRIDAIPPDMVDLLPVTDRRGKLETVISSNAIAMTVRVKKEGAVKFRLTLDRDAFGPPPATGPSFLETATITLAVEQRPTPQASLGEFSTAPRAIAITSTATASRRSLATSASDPALPLGRSLPSRESGLLFPDELPTLDAPPRKNH